MNLAKIINSLTQAELVEFIGYYRWRQQHGSFDDTKRYRSRSYFTYHTSRWISQAERALDAKTGNGPEGHA